MGTFMACVFYVGPKNNFGKKELNPTFWLKLFLLSKESSLTFSWKDTSSDQVRTLHLPKADWRVWLRFYLSALVNGVGFHFLLHLLPIQVASMSNIIGVVFRAVGMIYLVDLDDISGNTMTLVPQSNNGTGEDYGSNTVGVGNEKELEEEKQKIIDEAVQDVKKKLEALALGGRPSLQSKSSNGMGSITQALFRATKHRKKKTTREGTDEETPLM